MKVFRKEKFLEEFPDASGDILWVELCDGKEVINGKIHTCDSLGVEADFRIVDEWCEEI